MFGLKHANPCKYGTFPMVESEILLDFLTLFLATAMIQTVLQGHFLTGV